MTNGCTAACWSDRHRQLWFANKRLRQAEIACRLAVDACKVVATMGPGTLPTSIAILTLRRIAKNKCDAITAELPPWVERRGVTLVLER